MTGWLPATTRDCPALALFAAELRAARQHAGLTRDELSAKVNYSSSLIGMIETGRRVPLT